MMIIEKRLGELETENSEKKDTIVVLDSTNKNLETNIKDKESTVNILSIEIDMLKNQMRYLFCFIYLFSIHSNTIDSVGYRNMEVNSATEKAALSNKISELEFQRARVDREKLNLEGELAASLKEIAGLRSSVAEVTSASAGLQAKYDALQMALVEQTNRADGLDQNLVVANTKIQDLEVGFFFYYYVPFKEE